MNQRLAKMMKMGMPYGANPDFASPEIRAKLMDFCVEQEWWNLFVGEAYVQYSGSTIVPRGEFIKYLWKHLPELIDEYRSK
jgi:hypothetical protein